MRFHGICIVTRNVNDLRDFYEEILQARYRQEGDFVEFSTEGATLTIYSTEGMNKLSPGSMDGSGHGALSIEFEVHNVDQEFERLKTLDVNIVKEPTTQPWGR